MLVNGYLDFKRQVDTETLLCFIHFQNNNEL